MIFKSRSLNRLNLLGAMFSAVVITLFLTLFASEEYTTYISESKALGQLTSINEAEKRLVEQRQLYLEQRFNDFLFRLLILTLVMVLTIGLLSNFFSSYLKSEVQKLARYFSKIGGEEKADETELPDIEELKEIGGYAKQMAWQIREKSEELNRLNSELEQKVEQKTERLTAQNEELMKAKSYAERLVKLQDRFVKGAIHEINTPLSVIGANIELMALKNEHSPHLKKIEAAAKTITSIYEDLGYFVKKDRFKQQKRLINLSSFLYDRIEYFKEVAEANNLAIKEEISEERYIFFDETQLQRIVDNNISNAIKYSKERTEIFVKLHKKEGKIELAFENSSHKTDAIEWKKERFFRRDDQKGGLGIGLELVYEIAVQNGVQLDASNDNGKVRFAYLFEDFYDDAFKSHVY